MAVYRSRKVNKDEDKVKKTKRQQVPDDAMSKLARLMNDSPTILKLRGTEWEVRSLKPGTQWLIAEEACRIVDKENASMGDVLKQFAVNMPSVCRVLTLALLNDKHRIYGDEYEKVYQCLMWGDYDMKDWATFLAEILNLIDVDFFFASTNVAKMLRRSTLDRKMTTEEQN